MRTRKRRKRRNRERNSRQSSREGRCDDRCPNSWLFHPVPLYITKRFSFLPLSVSFSRALPSAVDERKAVDVAEARKDNKETSKPNKLRPMRRHRPVRVEGARGAANEDVRIGDHGDWHVQHSNVLSDDVGALQFKRFEILQDAQSTLFTFILSFSSFSLVLLLFFSVFPPFDRGLCVCLLDHRHQMSDASVRGNVVGMSRDTNAIERDDLDGRSDDGMEIRRQRIEKETRTQTRLTFHSTQ